ncbi:MAG: rhomboid family intramembrane serine protease [Brachymonas sp.]|nr:rhomboid family intramembrane serine protease [Brachymonas sp.]
MYDPSPRDDRFTYPTSVPAPRQVPPPSLPPGAHGPRHPLLLPVLLIAINAGVWLWTVLGGANAFSPKPADLEAWGGNSALLTLHDQPWRLFTSMFLHAGATHLFFNMYFLFQIGPLLVRRKGPAGFAVVYLGGGLLASMASAWWQLQSILRTGAGQLPRLIVSVGASGAIMAVAGALACSLVLGHWRVQNDARGYAYSVADRSLMQSLLQVIAVNVAMGFFISGLDQAAHLGGLLAGALLGLILPGVADRLPAAKRWLRVAAAAGASGLLLAAAWLLIRHGQQFERAYELLLRHVQQGR